MDYRNNNEIWTLLDRLVVYELFCRKGRKSLAKNNPDLLAIAQDLLRTPGSVSARIGNYSSLSHDQVCSRAIDMLLGGDWMFVAKLLNNVGYKPRISFYATLNACKYLYDFPASAAHTLLGGRPFMGKMTMGYTPEIDINGIVRNINYCIPRERSKFDVTSLLHDIKYVFVTALDDGNRINKVYGEKPNMADTHSKSGRLMNILESIREIRCRGAYDIWGNNHGKQSINGMASYDIERGFYAIERLLERTGIPESYNNFHSIVTANVPQSQCQEPYPCDIDEFYIPTEDERNLGRDLLGCYLPGRNIILLWVDKIKKYGDLKELIFQKVLLHECIHALLDISRRACSDYREEETVDNVWVLNAYSQCGQSSVINEVIDFISSQPEEYRHSLDCYPWAMRDVDRHEMIKVLTRRLLIHKG